VIRSGGGAAGREIGRARLTREVEWSRARANAGLWIGIANLVIGLVLLYLIASR